MKGCRVINETEIKDIMNSLNMRDRVLILTGLTFGTRISESLSLTFGNVEGSYLHINSKKGSENISFPVPSSYKSAIEDLKTYYKSQGIEIKPDTYLFLSRKGDNMPITRIQASRIVKETCISLGIDGKVNTHSFRKTFVTKIYNLTGHDIAQTKVYSRHKSLSNLDYYINTTQETNLINELAW